jgi:membrane protein implicated in regulation of membrane protease activity
MNLTRKEQAAAAVAAALSVGIVLAIVLDSWQWSLAFVSALMLVLAAVILMTMRRHDATRTADLERIERKIDNLALRVVTESQATHRELGGLIEELGSNLRGP